MEMETKPHQISFMSACVQFFGPKPGQKALQFGQEVKQLTPEDRKELKPMLEAELGLEIIA